MGRRAHHDNTATIHRIRSLPLFSTCRRRELAALASNMTVTTVPEGTELTRQGGRGHQFFVVLSGTADVLVDGEVVGSLGRGDHFGELALIGRQPRAATVVATGALEVLVSHQTEFAIMLALAPSFRRRLTSTIAA